MEYVVLVQSLSDTPFPVVKEGIPSYLADVKSSIPSFKTFGSFIILNFDLVQDLEIRIWNLAVAIATLHSQ